MAVDLYQGNYISAESAINEIDKASIDEGCAMLKEASEKLSQTAKKIDLLREICDRNALSVRGKTMENVIEEYEKNTNEFSLYISDLSETLSNTTQRVVNRRQIILNEEAKRLDLQEMTTHEIEEEVGVDLYEEK